MGTLQEFIKKHRVVMYCAPVDSNPYLAIPWPDASHWKCHLRTATPHRRRRVVFYYSQGPAFTQPPTAEEVLNAIASDASGLDEYGTFEGWAREYGYDVDSRKAERVYQAVQKNTHKLKNWLSPEAYQELVSETERL